MGVKKQPADIYHTRLVTRVTDPEKYMSEVSSKSSPVVAVLLCMMAILSAIIITGMAMNSLFSLTFRVKDHRSAKAEKLILHFP